MERKIIETWFVQLTTEECKSAILYWLANREPPIHAQHVDSLDEAGATIVINRAERNPFENGGDDEEWFDDDPSGGERRFVNLRDRIIQFAKTAPLHQIACAEIQKRLIDIANERD